MLLTHAQSAVFVQSVSGGSSVADIIQGDLQASRRQSAIDRGARQTGLLQASARVRPRLYGVTRIHGYDHSQHGEAVARYRESQPLLCLKIQSSQLHVKSLNIESSQPRVDEKTSFSEKWRDQGSHELWQFNVTARDLTDLSYSSYT